MIDPWRTPVLMFDQFEDWSLRTSLWYHHLGMNVSAVLIFFFFLIGIHPMQGWTATTRHGVTRKKTQKRLQDTENLFKKNLQLKDVC